MFLCALYVPYKFEKVGYQFIISYKLKVFLLPFSEELKKLRKLVIDAKENNIKVVSSLVRKMLEKNTFLFGFVDTNEESFAETINQLTQLQNARVQVAYKE